MAGIYNRSTSENVTIRVAGMCPEFGEADLLR